MPNLSRAIAAPEPPLTPLEQFLRTYQPATRAAGAILVAAAVALGRVLKPALVAAGQTMLALILIFEEWGWEPLYRLLGVLVRLPVIARVERLISRLPPYGALTAFAVPVLCLIPVKLFAVYLFASGYWLKGVLLLLGAKLASTAIVARMYFLTLPALMQIPWFNRVHDRFVAWKDAAFARIRVSAAWRTGRFIKDRVQRLTARIRRRIGKRLRELKMAILEQLGAKAVTTRT